MDRIALSIPELECSSCGWVGTRNGAPTSDDGDYPCSICPRCKPVTYLDDYNTSKEAYEERLADARSPKNCIWTLTDEFTEEWETGCGESHYFTEGTPASNDHRYCPYCGGKLEVKE